MNGSSAARVLRWEKSSLPANERGFLILSRIVFTDSIGDAWIILDYFAVFVEGKRMECCAFPTDTGTTSTDIRLKKSVGPYADYSNKKEVLIGAIKRV